MSRTVTTIVTVTATVLAFGLLWASIAFEWDLQPWIIGGAYGLFFCAVLLAPLRTRSRRRRTITELYASDAYSDLQMGRRPFTHPHRDTHATSHVGEPPENYLR